MAQVVVSGTFEATGQSASFVPQPPAPLGHEKGSGYFNLSIWGTYSATVKLQRSFDDGTTWMTVSQDSLGTEAAYTAPISAVALEPEQGVIYRLSCTAFASGVVNYRLSR